jgi:hypothetical protein
MGPHGNVNLPRRTRADLVSAARAGVKKEDLDDHEAQRRKKLAEAEKPRMLTAPVERKTGGAHRVEMDVDHFTVLRTLAVLAVRWHHRLEESGLPATQRVARLRGGRQRVPDDRGSRRDVESG